MKLQTLRPVHVFCIAVGIAGTALVAVLVVLAPPRLEHFTSFTFLALAASVMLGELFPLELPRRSGDGEVTVSTMFSFALVLGVGLLPALVAQLAASVVQDLAARKPRWQIFFNMGQYALSLAAAAALVRLALGHTLLNVPDMQARDLLVVLAAASAFFVVNLLLVTRATTLYEGTPFSRAVRTDLAFGLSVGAVLLCLAPVVVTVLQSTPVLYPLLFVPLIGVYAGGKQSARTAQAEHMATHDSLTELPNRRWFREEVSRALADGGLRNAGVLLVDLNRFKEVNDTLGHHHGDRVLQQLGPRLLSTFRSQDLVARLGGDEFAVFMPEVDAPAVQHLCDQLQAALHTPVEAEGISIELDASVGLAWYPAHGSDVDTLLQRADVAMYRAKATQRHLVAYRPEDDYHSPARLALSSDLRRALADDQLVLHYQPQVDLALGRPVAAEGLVRWAHPERGLLAPNEFIEMAEHTGIVKDLTYRVIALGLNDLRQWRRDGRDLSLSLNVSVRSLLDRAFPAEVERLLGEYGVDGSALTLELTESSLMVDPGVAMRAMHELSEIGVSFAIDDFGTGYSSLSYLTDLPVRELKIDKSFVLAMNLNARNRIIVHSTIDLARHLGLRTVAEGIEDNDTLNGIRDLGCELAQGFHISRPLPVLDLLGWWDGNAGRPEPQIVVPRVTAVRALGPKIRAA